MLERCLLMCIYVDVISKHINIKCSERGMAKTGPFYSVINEDERQGFAEHRGHRWELT